MKNNLILYTIFITLFVVPFYLTAQRVGIGTNNPLGTLHINGNVIVTNTETINNAIALGVDNNGNVGKIYYPLKAAIIQSVDNQVYTPNSTTVNSLNNANPIAVTWNNSNIISNNIMTFNSNDNSFSFNEGGVYELSGYISYMPGATISTTENNLSNPNFNLIALNVTIQKYNAQTSSWQNIAGTRWLQSGPGIQYYSETITIPAVAYTFSAEDKIRFVFYRPLAGFATPHGTIGNCGIVRPDGIPFSKGLKIIKTNN